MIVKKMPILQGFPDFETVKKLSKYVSVNCGNTPVFYDIETTGLSRYSTFLYLIGAVIQEDNRWFLYQWMAEKEEEEPEILCEFFNFLASATSTIQYNGRKFDQPYLEERYKKHNLPSPFRNLPALDLYQELKPCKNLLNLERMKQPDLEKFLGRGSRTHCDGGQCIRLYKSYIKNPTAESEQIILGHNQEDLLGLGCIFPMLGYRALMKGSYLPLKAETDESQIILYFQLPAPVPKPVSKKGKDFYVTVREQEGALLVVSTDQKIRQYYQDYKSYDYIPGEDTAMPRQLSQYMDKSLRVPATPETCYTWFPCTESFLSNPEKQTQYLKSTLPCLLGL